MRVNSWRGQARAKTYSCWFLSLSGNELLVDNGSVFWNYSRKALLVHASAQIERESFFHDFVFMTLIFEDAMRRVLLLKVKSDNRTFSINPCRVSMIVLANRREWLVAVKIGRSSI